MPATCAHCEFPPCPSCLTAERCAFCNRWIDTAEVDAAVPDVDSAQLAGCIEDHEHWANLFILHRRMRQRIRLRESPGCWLLIWGWPLLIGLSAAFISVQEALSGRPGALLGPLIAGTVIAMIWWFLEVNARVKVAARASLPVLDLLATADTSACVACEAGMPVSGPGVLKCEACGASHVVQLAIGEMSKSMCFGRLAEAKRLGHEAAAQAETVHLARWPLNRSVSSSFSRRIHDAHFSPACLVKLRRLKS
jgi:hypothetical protein